ncbi:MAG: hypothetical protein NVSMB32_13670 [Actinomycetota bacterium]
MVEARPQSPAGNMALDEDLLAQAIRGGCGEALLRVYRWVPATLSVGAKLEIPAEVRRRCTEAGVALVRRATGGGCVLHDGDVTYSVVAPDHGRGVLEAYRWVAQGLIAAFASLGVRTEVAEHPARGRPLDCFQAATGADLTVGGAKICGSAQVRRNGWFLQHGSIPLGDIRAKTAHLLGGSVDDRSTCLDRIRPGTEFYELTEALVAGFTHAWGAPQGVSAGRPLRDPLGMV